MDHDASIRSKTTKSFFWSGSSNLILQVLTVLFGVWLGRLLSPEEYGIVGLLTVFTVVATSLQESGLLTALINRKNINHTDYNAVFWFNVAGGLLLYLILFFAAPWIARFYDTPELVPLARYSFLAIVFASFSVAQNAFLLKNLRIKQRGIASIAAALSSNIVGISMVLLGYSYWGFATINVVYQFVVMLCFWGFSSFRPTFQISIFPLRDMVPFGLNILSTNIFNQISTHIFAVLLGRFYTVTQVGNFTQGNKWALASQSVITGMLNNLTQVLLNEVKESDEKYRSLFLKILQVVCFIAFPTLFMLALVANDFIVVLITEKWLDSALFLRYFSLLGPFLIISFLFTQVILSRNRSALYRNITISLAIAIIALQLIIYPYGIKVMIVGYAALQMIWMLIWQFYTCQLTAIRFLDITKIVLKYTIVSGVAILLAYYTTNFLDNIYLRLIARIITAGAIYLGTIFLVDPKFVKNAFQMVKGLRKDINS